MTRTTVATAAAIAVASAIESTSTTSVATTTTMSNEATDLEKALFVDVKNTSDINDLLDKLSTTEHENCCIILKKTFTENITKLIQLAADQEAQQQSEAKGNETSVESLHAALTSIARICDITCCYVESTSKMRPLALFPLIQTLHNQLIFLEDFLTTTIDRIVIPKTNKIVVTQLQHIQSTIAKSCEFLWIHKEKGAEHFVTQLIPYLLLTALKPNAHETGIKRLYKVQTSLLLLDFDDGSIESIREMLLQCFQSALFLKSSDGKRFLSFLFSVDKKLHNLFLAVIKSELVEANIKTATAYGTILYNAWKNNKDNNNNNNNNGLRDSIEECLQSLIHDAIHAASNKYFKSLRLALSVFHDHKRYQGVDSLLLRVYGPILWRSLRVANVTVRVQATMLFFDSFPLQDEDASTVDVDMILQKQFDLLTTMLQDEHHHVRAAAVTGVCFVLKEFWNALPIATTKQTLTYIITVLGRDASDANVRHAVVVGVETLLQQPSSHACLKLLLPVLGNMIHDVNEKVRAAFVSRVLLSVKSLKLMTFYAIVPVEHLLTRLALEYQHHQQQQQGQGYKRSLICDAMTTLLFNSFFPPTRKSNSSSSGNDDQGDQDENDENDKLLLARLLENTDDSNNNNNNNNSSVDSGDVERIRRCVEFVRKSPIAAQAFYSHVCHPQQQQQQVSLMMMIRFVVLLFQHYQQAASRPTISINSSDEVSSKKQNKRDRSTAATTTTTSAVAIDDVQASELLRLVLVILRSLEKQVITATTTSSGGKLIVSVLRRYFSITQLNPLIQQQQQQQQQQEGDEEGARLVNETSCIALQLVSLIEKMCNSNSSNNSNRRNSSSNSNNNKPLSSKQFIVAFDEWFQHNNNNNNNSNNNSVIDKGRAVVETVFSLHEELLLLTLILHALRSSDNNNNSNALAVTVDKQQKKKRKSVSFQESSSIGNNNSNSIDDGESVRIGVGAALELLSLLLSQLSVEQSTQLLSSEAPATVLLSDITLALQNNIINILHNNSNDHNHNNNNNNNNRVELLKSTRVLWILSTQHFLSTAQTQTQTQTTSWLERCYVWTSQQMLPLTSKQQQQQQAQEALDCLAVAVSVVADLFSLKKADESTARNLLLWTNHFNNNNNNNNNGDNNGVRVVVVNAMAKLGCVLVASSTTAAPPLPTTTTTDLRKLQTSVAAFLASSLSTSATAAKALQFIVRHSDTVGSGVIETAVINHTINNNNNNASGGLLEQMLQSLSPRVVTLVQQILQRLTATTTTTAAATVVEDKQFKGLRKLLKFVITHLKSTTSTTTTTTTTTTAMSSIRFEVLKLVNDAKVQVNNNNNNKQQQQQQQPAEQVDSDDEIDENNNNNNNNNKGYEKESSSLLTLLSKCEEKLK